jgi:hypothetical protein
MPDLGNATRRRIDLSGQWEWLINGEYWDFITVPSSLHLVGIYVLKRSIWLPKLENGQRSFLHFDAVTYYVEAIFNGKKVGEMGPYVPYEFEVTELMREGESTIEVIIHDLVPGPSGAGKDEIAIGVNPGWEAYGGIIRDVWIEIRSQAFVKNVRLAYTLSENFSQASCELTVFSDASKAVNGNLIVDFTHGHTEVARVSSPLMLQPGTTTTELSFNVPDPLLWSPDQPHLYKLSATLHTAEASDALDTRTGFRQCLIRGRQFFWNGTPLVLQGLCRHDMWQDQGFTLTRAQMEQDMRAIKFMGANFVRLVHYPHHRNIIDLAEELGLLVTEEPGYWQVEFPSMPPSEIDAGLRILEGVIRRDWNSPAVFGWFLGNESRLTVDYLRRGKALCNQLDPLKRPVSFANSTAKEKVKQQFEEAGLDFFSQHLYEFDREKFETTADYYGSGKPLVIDEWGWEDAGNGEIFWDRNFDGLLDATREGKIAGHSFWSWNDVRQYARIDWPTYDGILFSGVVTEARRPRTELYRRLSSLFQGQPDNPEGDRLPHALPFAQRPNIVPLRIGLVNSRGAAKPIDLQPMVDSSSARDSWKALEKVTETFWGSSQMAQDQWARTGKRLLFWRDPLVEIAGLPFVCPLQDGFVRPLVISPEFPEQTIPIGQDCDRLYLLGNVTLPSGYPVEGEKGATAAVFEVRYVDGRNQQIPLRNGNEIARSNLIDDATRIEPLAVNAPQALVFEKDPAREHYQALLFAIPVQGALRELHCTLKSGPPLAIFAVTVQNNRSKEAQAG